MFESLLSPEEVRKKPWKMLILGIIYTSLGIIVANWVFPQDPSLSIIFLTTMAAIPIVIRVLRIEAEEDYTKREYPLIGNHKDVLAIIFFLFMGMLISFVAWYLILPEETSTRLFSSQIRTIQGINNQIQGSYIHTELLQIIIANNLRVLFFCIIFSLLYCAGAIFIITWNASVLATAISKTIQSINNPLAIPIGFGQYLIHGIPEVIAYFLGAIAGGIISTAVIRHKGNKFKEIIIDSIDLIILAVAVLIIAGLIEVYISIGA